MSDFRVVVHMSTGKTKTVSCRTLQSAIQAANRNLFWLSGSRVTVEFMNRTIGRFEPLIMAEEPLDEGIASSLLSEIRPSRRTLQGVLDV